MRNIIFLCLFISQTTFASIFKDVVRQEYITKSNIDPHQVQMLVDQLETLFTPIFDEHKAELIFEINWEDPTINLYAEQIGFSWFVHVYLGYYSLPEMTEDALALSLCHEIGHHLSGYPYKSTWSSAEGQADYFANHICTELLWKNDDNSSYVKEIPEKLLRLCQNSYPQQDEIELCSRKMLAGMQLAEIMATYSHSTVEQDIAPLPATPTMLYQHPSPQCRLNTFLRASLCHKPFNLKIIPGKQKARVVPVPRPAQGVNNLWARRESMQNSCDEEITSELLGARPHCWFK